MAQIIVSPQAEQDLAQIVDEIGNKAGPAIADKLLDRIVAIIEKQVPPPPASKAVEPSMRTRGEDAMPRTWTAAGDLAAHATGRPSPMALLVGVMGRICLRPPPPDASSGLARLPSVPRARRWPVQTADASPSPLVRDEGFAFVTGGGEAQLNRAAVGPAPRAGKPEDDC
jgi:plasmid stabilization system protein ParE